MARHRPWWGVSLIGLSGWLLTGCVSTPEWALPKHSYAEDISPSPVPRLTRLQTSESPPAPLPKPKLPPLAANPPVIAPPPGALQTSLTTRGTVRVSIRAWVNGRPIFDDEVMQMAGPELARVYALSGSERSEKLTELINKAVEQLVDQELMYQDAVKKLEKNNSHTLDKLKELVNLEFDKSLQRMRQAGVSEQQIRDLEPTARRMLERSLIATEYARSRIMGPVQSRVGLAEIREYYDTHKNEFRTVDKIAWQDIFIPVNANLPTVEEAKRFAEELINKCRTPEDFNRLMVYNEGDSKLRKGEGLGQRRGEIRPAELEEHLFNLREGAIGPVVPFTTGVHLIRVTQREYAKQLPLDDAVQKTIRKKLENQLAEREYRRIVRELRGRSVVRLERAE